MSWKKFLLVSVVILIVGIGLKPAKAINTSTEPSLPDSLEEKQIVDFQLTITDIQGDCILIETDLDKDGSTPIFDTTSLTEYQITVKGKSLEICGTFPTKLTVPIHGKIPEGIDRQTLTLPNGQTLYLKFFDTGQKNYYRVKDVKGNNIIDSTSKSFTIVHPQLEEVKKVTEANITDPNAKQIIVEYVELGLIDYVQKDLIPLFVRYDPDRINTLENKVLELENLVKELNTTVVKQKDTIASLQRENDKLKNENSGLKSQVSELQAKVSELESQVSLLTQENESYQGSTRMFKMTTIVLAVLLIGGVFFAHTTGRKSGYKEGHRKGYSEGKREGYERGKQDGYREGYEDGVNECRQKTEGGGVL